MKMLISVLGLAALLTVCTTPQTKSSMERLPSAPDKVLWPSWGGALENTHQAIRSQGITARTIENLQVKWVYETKGDVSAIPAVTQKYLYFPDWGRPFVGAVTGGSYLHAVERETGKAVWARPVEGYHTNLLNNIVRTSFAIDGDLLIFGDNRGITNSILSLPGADGASLYAVNRLTGDLVWRTVLDEHPLAIVTQSPVIHKGRIYVGTSSNEEAAARITEECCSFRGAMLALDLQTGKILWKRFMVPESREEDGFTGNAVWGSQPAIDVKRNSVYIATGNNYTIPRLLEDCLRTHRGKPREQQKDCYNRFDVPDNYASSVLALDLDSGVIRWARKLENFGAWTYACDPKLVPMLPTKDSNCEDMGSLDFDFGQAPMLVRTRTRDLVAVGQKSGVFWAFDPDRKGATVWSQFVGPGGALGGMEFGSAADGEKIYVAITNFDHVPFTVGAGPQAGQVAKGGIWAALDAVTGKILWQTLDPWSDKPLEGKLAHISFGRNLGDGFFATDKGPLTVANDVLFGGSMDRPGHMYGFDTKDGRIIWSFESGGSVMSAPAVVDDVLYWGSGYSKTGFRNNRVYAFSPAERGLNGREGPRGLNGREGPRGPGKP